MRLTELNPRWWAAPERRGQGVVFLCPHCRSTERPMWICVAFLNPLDWGEPFPIKKIGLLMKTIYACGVVPVGQPMCPPGILWGRAGDTFENLTIQPSVDASPAGCWHGWVRNGDVT